MGEIRDMPTFRGEGKQIVDKNMRELPVAIRFMMLKVLYSSLCPPLLLLF